MIRIIIDAYNLIFQCGFHPKKLDAPLALYKARQRLIHELVLRIKEQHRPDVILVFDAKNPRGQSTPDLEPQGFRIAYARDFEDADAMVIEILRQHSQPRQLTVVSSDHQIQTAATRRDATAMDADVWFDRLTLLSDAAPDEPSGKASAILSDQETQQLIDAFSQPDEVEIPERTDSKKAGDIQEESPYNPFPPGYGEDLLGQ